MKRMRTVEAVFDVLVGAGLNEEHSCFDDAVWACVDCALPGAAVSDPAESIAQRDEERDEVEIVLDLVEWAKASGCKEPISDVLERAIWAGRKAWLGENGVSATA